MGLKSFWDTLGAKISRIGFSRALIIIYFFALLWLWCYLFWTLSDDGVQKPGWIGQTEAFAFFLLLILVGIIVGMVQGKRFFSRALVALFFCSCVVLTYANTSWNLYDATARRKYVVFQGCFAIHENAGRTPQFSRFEFVQREESARSFRFNHGDFRVSLWFPVALISLFLFAPEMWSAVRWFQRRGRATRGACSNCGYNLTGLIEPRCPECGASL